MLKINNIDMQKGKRVSSRPSEGGESLEHLVFGNVKDTLREDKL